MEEATAVMWWNDGGWGAGHWVAMSLTMVLFWSLLAVLVFLVVRSVRTDHDQGRPPTPPSPTATADQLLAERFARGEIDAEEFANRRAVLHDAVRDRAVGA